MSSTLLPPIQAHASRETIRHGSSSSVVTQQPSVIEEDERASFEQKIKQAMKPSAKSATAWIPSDFTALPAETPLPELYTDVYNVILEDALEQLRLLKLLSESDQAGDTKSSIARPGDVKKNVRTKAIKGGDVMAEVSDTIQHLLQSHSLLEQNDGTDGGVLTFRAPPSAAANLHKLARERTDLMVLFDVLSLELGHTGHYSCLLQALRQEDKRRQKVRMATSREPTPLQTQHAQLTKTLAQEAALLQSELAAATTQLHTLKDTHAELVKLTAAEQSYLKKESAAHAAIQNTVRATTLDKLEEEVLQVKREEEVENNVYSLTMGYLTKQLSALEQEVNGWMDKYETDTENLTETLETLKSNRTRDLDAFEQLVGQFEKLTKVVEADREQRRKADEERKIIETRHRAARRIQRWYRKCKLAKKAAKKTGKKAAPGAPGAKKSPSKPASAAASKTKK